MILFPPWQWYSEDFGYGFIATPPTKTERVLADGLAGYAGEYTNKIIRADTIQWTKLGLQILVVGLLTGVGMLTSKDSDANPEARDGK